MYLYINIYIHTYIHTYIHLCLNYIALNNAVAHIFMYTIWQSIYIV